MKIQVEISNVVTAKEQFCFVAVQMDYDDQVTPTLKFRTDLSVLTNRPKFSRNLFTFEKVIEKQKLKFGLMECKDSSESSINNSKVIGLASIGLHMDRLKSLPAHGQKQIIKFLNKQKQVGQFQCKIIFTSDKRINQLNGSKVKNQIKREHFNPLISRILFTEQGSKDEIRMYSNINQLEKQVQALYAKFSVCKEEEETLQNIYNVLVKDQQNLKCQIQVNQKINQKIAIKINQKQSFQPMKLEIDMLKSSEQGKGLLLQKLEYFEERIKIEDEEYRMLAQRYEHIKKQIDKRIKRAQNYAQKLKGKQIQQFQIDKNQGILKRFEDIQYEFSCNQQIINSLVKKSTHSELTAQQASLLLSQVNFQIKLEEIGSGQPQKQEGLLALIEKQALLINGYERQNISEQERLVCEIKLSALEEQIGNVRNKMKRVMPKGNITESIVTKY